MNEDDEDSWCPPKSRQVEKQELSALAAVKDWIVAVTKTQLKFPDDLRKSLENGAVLCELLNCLKPCIRKINRLPTPMASLDNLNVFFARCKSVFSIRDGYLFDLHDLDDLTQRALKEEELEFESRKRLLRVAVCIFWIAKSSESFYDGPQLNYSAFSTIINDQNRALASSNQVNTQKLRNFAKVNTAVTAFSNHSAPEKKSPEKTNNKVTLRSRDRSSIYELKDPEYLAKKAVEQLKQTHDNKMWRNPQDSGEHDEETGVWQASLNNWREKRRRASASLSAQALELKVAEERKLESQLHESRDSKEFTSWLGVTSSLSVDESEPADVFAASGDGDVFSSMHKQESEAESEIQPVQIQMAATSPKAVIRNDSRSSARTTSSLYTSFDHDVDSPPPPLPDESPPKVIWRRTSSKDSLTDISKTYESTREVCSNGITDSEHKMTDDEKELYTPEFPRTTFEILSENFASVDDSNLSSGIDEGQCNTTATDSSNDVNGNVKLKKETAKEADTSSNDAVRHQKKKYAAPPPPQLSVSPTSSPVKTHRKGRAPPPPVASSSGEEKKEPLTPPRTRRSSQHQQDEKPATSPVRTSEDAALPSAVALERTSALTAPNGRHSFDGGSRLSKAKERNSGPTVNDRRRSSPATSSGGSVVNQQAVPDKFTSDISREIQPQPSPSSKSNNHRHHKNILWRCCFRRDKE